PTALVASTSCALPTFFFFYRPCDHRHLHSFPTRRSSDLAQVRAIAGIGGEDVHRRPQVLLRREHRELHPRRVVVIEELIQAGRRDRKSTRLNSSHVKISYAVFCLKKKKKQ